MLLAPPIDPATTSVRWTAPPIPELKVEDWTRTPTTMADGNDAANPVQQNLPTLTLEDQLTEVMQLKTLAKDWTPSSWRSKPVAQAVEYPDQEKLDKVLGKIRSLPGLVAPAEIERLRHQLAAVQRNEAFLLHAGDCAESFDACTQEMISAKIGLILSFSLILIWGQRMPVVRIGRIAGQYAKPRSSPKEKLADGREVMSFRGDNVNGLDPDSRTPDPERMLDAYFHSAATINHIRTLLSSGFASLSHPREWSLSHVRSAALRAEFERITEGLSDALDFSRTIGYTAGQDCTSYERGGSLGALDAVDFYTSHEGLMLDFEEALTREFPVPQSPSRPSSRTVSRSVSVLNTPKLGATVLPGPFSAISGSFKANGNGNGADGISHGRRSSGGSNGFPQRTARKAWYNTSAHFIWIGDRTRQLTGAHVEYFRGIRNPVGIKVGPSMAADELVRLLEIVNPDREGGRVTLITRYGAAKVDDHLPGHIEAVLRSGHPVVWVCDPMHGNTQTAATGHKTRHFGTIISEIVSAMRIHAESGSRLGGVSLEFTGEMNDEGFSVTECVGGSMELSEEELGLRYQSFCDPRLNFEQSLDVAFTISNQLKRERHGSQHGADALYSELVGRKVSQMAT